MKRNSYVLIALVLCFAALLCGCSSAPRMNDSVSFTEDEDTVLEHIRPMLHAPAAKAWYPTLPDKIPFADYEAFTSRIGNAPNAHAEA